MRVGKLKPTAVIPFTASGIKEYEERKNIVDSTIRAPQIDGKSIRGVPKFPGAKSTSSPGEIFIPGAV